MMLYTDPARHPALILVEALDLSQVSGRGALHLETLLRKKNSQRTESKVAFDWVNFINNPEIWLDWRHIYQRTASEAIIVCASKHNRHKPLSVSMPTPLSLATTETVQQGFHTALHSLPQIHFGCLCTFCQLCPSGGTGARILISLMTYVEA